MNIPYLSAYKHISRASSFDVATFSLQTAKGVKNQNKMRDIMVSLHLDRALLSQISNVHFPQCCPYFTNNKM
jgi:hypothetical protein